PTTTPVPTTTLAPTTLPPTTTPDKIIKVYHFHATHQCTSCILAGEYAYYTIITYFPDEFSNGTITYDSLNYEDPKNSTIVNKLNVYGSSVFVLEAFPDDTIVHNPTYNLFRRVSSKQSYAEYFKNYIEELL
ncbi:MAG: nitrophenyl compound nitroreductase subunit ArsF family protein, partial [Candidatus Methanofastidiosia archaeon]